VLTAVSCSLLLSQAFAVIMVLLVSPSLFLLSVCSLKVIRVGFFCFKLVAHRCSFQRQVSKLMAIIYFQATFKTEIELASWVWSIQALQSGFISQCHPQLQSHYSYCSLSKVVSPLSFEPFS